MRMRDPPMAEVDEVFDGEPRAVHVVGPNHVDESRPHGPGDDDHG